MSKKTKKKKAKAFVVRASDANGDRLAYRVTGLSAKKGKVTGAGPSFKFTPKKKFKGKVSFFVTVTDGKGGAARTKVYVTVK